MTNYAKIKDLTGLKYGRLTVSKYVSQNKSHNSLWLCKCDCGNEKIVPSPDLRQGKTKSCGCLFKETITILNAKHGCFYSRFYKIWAAMKARCDNPNTISYKKYGGSGIVYQASWSNFESFKNDMYESYLKHCEAYSEKETTIDRINNYDGYSTKNCRWATKIEQANNKKCNKLIAFNGETLTIAETAHKHNIKPTTFWCRLYKYGWSVEKAVTTPVAIRRFA
jgi:hypothetical protein